MQAWAARAAAHEVGRQPLHRRQQPSLRGAELKERRDGIGVFCCGCLGSRQQRCASLGGRAGSSCGSSGLCHQRLFEECYSVRDLGAPASGLAGLLLLQAGLQGREERSAQALNAERQAGYHPSMHALYKSSGTNPLCTRACGSPAESWRA